MAAEPSWSQFRPKGRLWAERTPERRIQLTLSIDCSLFSARGRLVDAEFQSATCIRAEREMPDGVCRADQAKLAHSSARTISAN